MKKFITAAVMVYGINGSSLMAAPINQEVANVYNDGIVRCANEQCAKYLYACFRTYSSGPLQEFLNCGSQAARLNDNKMVIPST